MAVIGAAAAVLGQCPAELRHGQNDRVVHTGPKIRGERGDRRAEVGEAVGELTRRAAPSVDVMVPLCAFRERDFEPDVGFGELRDLAKRLSEWLTAGYSAPLRWLRSVPDRRLSILIASKASLCPCR